MSAISVDVALYGPIFRPGVPRRVMADYTDAAVSRVARHGKAEVDKMLHRVLRHPTGNYQAHIRIREFSAAAVIHDSRIIYGRWLEGTGSRNFPKTIFKGYHTFRTVHAALVPRAAEIAQVILPHYLRRLQ